MEFKFIGLQKSFFSYTHIGDTMKKLIIVLLLLIPVNIKAIDTSATSAILIDTNSKRILYSKDIHNKRSIASISKIMTAILAIESNKLDDMVEIGNEIEDAYGSGIYIKQNEHIKLEDLVYGLMLRSGNDAALAIAKYVGGSVEEFVNMMNNKAIDLGMKNSLFNNPSGLDEEDGGNISTAYDMSLLISYAINNDKFREIVGTKKHTLQTDMNVYSWTNKNKLLFSYKYTTGGKTGFTQIARRTLVTTASKDGLNLAVVTLNDGNDFLDHKNLFEYGFNTYTNYQILTKGKIDIPDENINRNYEYYIENDYTYPLLESEVDNILLKYKLDSNPEKGGVLEVYLGDKKIHDETIYIKRIEINKNTSLIKKIKDWFKNL